MSLSDDEKKSINEQNRSFENLACYQLGLRLFQAVYKLAGKLPDHERYNLTDQLRRAALSTLLNIAEGYGRFHYLEKLRYFYFARGSLSETYNALSPLLLLVILMMLNSYGRVIP